MDRIEIKAYAATVRYKHVKMYFGLIPAFKLTYLASDRNFYHINPMFLKIIQYLIQL